MFYLATNNNKNEDGDEDDISDSVKQKKMFCLKMVLGLEKMITLWRTWSVPFSQSAFSLTQEN